MIRYFCVLFFSIIAFAQQDSLTVAVPDSLTTYMFYLDEVDLLGDNNSQKEYRRLKQRVYKVYGFAKLTVSNLDKIDKTLASLKSKRDKKKYFKIAENYLTEQFEPRLKKLSYKDAMILIKLINRQSGLTTFDLIKNYKSGFKAVVSNTTARLFSLNLKTKYLPKDVKEDFLIEKILNEAFANFILVEQKPANPINFEELKQYWTSKK